MHEVLTGRKLHEITRSGWEEILGRLGEDSLGDGGDEVVREVGGFVAGKLGAW